jgi:predicted Zn-dependent protease
MRDRLPKLRALASSAPHDGRAVTQGFLATWQVELGDKEAAVFPAAGVWGKLRLAQKQVALGQAQDAAATLAALRKSADPDQPWAPVFWDTLLQNDQLQGKRDQAWKDLAEYKTRFKQLADPAMDQLLAGV